VVEFLYEILLILAGFSIFVVITSSGFGAGIGLMFLFLTSALAIIFFLARFISFAYKKIGISHNKVLEVVLLLVVLFSSVFLLSINTKDENTFDAILLRYEHNRGDNLFERDECLDIRSILKRDKCSDYIERQKNLYDNKFRYVE
jgi:hypothetical protein